MKTDVAIIGGGPAGLAVAIHAARLGLDTIIFERSNTLPDKACGEGLMPDGVRLLEQLGALNHLAPDEYRPFNGIRYVQENGSAIEANFSNGYGLGIRRTALIAALAKQVQQAGVSLKLACKINGIQHSNDAIILNSSQGDISAKLAVAADGLASPIRHMAGLDLPVNGSRRFGLRQHFLLPAWSPFVEVHWHNGVEAYVTPAGPQRIGVAFLWQAGLIESQASFANLLALFPALAARLSDAKADSEPRGAGPLARAAKSCIADRLVLIGDAAGYIDAITGEGLSLAFACAAALGEILPTALREGATKAALVPYQQAFSRYYRHYELATQMLLLCSRYPQLRRLAFRLLASSPKLFQSLMNWATSSNC